MKTRTTVFLAVVSTFLVLLLLPLVFRKKDPPPMAGPDLSEMSYSEVFFDNRSKGLRLAAMLLVPEGPGPFPTAVIVHGSGASRRNRVWYLSVAQYLQHSGIAVFLPDKRGSEKSEGEWLGADFDDLATDTISAVEYVGQQQLFACSSIGLIGFSQGGWIAPVAAAQTEDVSFVVSMSGSAVPVAEQLLHEQFNDIAGYTYAWIARLIAPITANRLKQEDHVAAFAGFDPMPYWKRVRVPVFFAFGENDPNVPVDASIERLRANGFAQFTVKTYPDGGHAIRDGRTNRVNDEYLRDLVEFIRKAAD